MPDRPNADLPKRERTEPEELRDWETIQQNETDVTQRLMIAEGWLYRTGAKSGSAVALVFVPASHR